MVKGYFEEQTIVDSVRPMLTSSRDYKSRLFRENISNLEFIDMLIIKVTIKTGELTISHKFKKIRN